MLRTATPSGNAASGRTLKTAGAIFLLLFVYAGHIKSNPALSWLPADLTLVTALVVALLMVAIRFSDGPASGNIFIIFGLWWTFVLGVFQASLAGYSLSKVSAIFTLNLLVAVAPFYLLRAEHQLKVLLQAIGYISVLAALYSIFQPVNVSEFSTASVLEGTNTISTGRMAGAGFLACLLPIIAGKVALRKGLILSVALVVLLMTLLSAGSRGPFIAVVCAVLYVIVASPLFSKYRFRAIFGVLLFTPVLLSIALGISSGGASRIFSFLLGETDTSNSMRLYIWDAAADHIVHHPFGIGWGEMGGLADFQSYTALSDRLYAHNLFLEIFLEAGWLTGLVVLAVVIFGVVRMTRLAATPLTVTFLSLLVFSIVNAMVSGDVGDNRLMWLLVGLAWAIRGGDKRELPSHTSRSPLVRQRAS